METFTAYATQFMRPDGRKCKVSTELPIELKDKYDLMIKSGCRLETEVLSTGQVSSTISDAKTDQYMLITKNNEHVKDAVISMLEEFDPSKLHIEPIE